MNLRALTHAALGATLAASTFAVSSPAAACGGLFCNSASPVNQQAERIIFARQPDGSITAVIQIQYQGPSEKFAWMLPVAGSPTIAVSSNAAFDRIQAATNPLYQLNTQQEGTCRDDLDQRGTAAPSNGDSAAEDPAPGGDDVTVVDSGSVGPYDYVIIALDPEAMDLVGVAIDWLQENGYDVPELGSAVLRPYLEAGMNLLAFRLTKGNDTGSIRPVTLSFGQGLPSIPIRPTAVAAQPDMGVMVWVLGEHRAVPANYRSLELNDALINWLNPNLNYNDVVIRAANEAQGQGFVTEHADSAPELGQSIWQPWEAEQWETLKATDWTGREGELINALGNFTALDGMRELFSAFLVPPSGVSEDDFYGCLPCYVEYNTADLEGFEPQAFMADMQTDVIDPLVDTQKLFAATTMSTRLYTTMSAHEMTVDPLFDFNPDLPTVTNFHQADRFIECSRFVDRADAPWRIELESGQTIRGKGADWPFATDTDAMPANSRITRVGNSGTGEVVEDNVASITQALTAHNKKVPGPKRGDDGCSVRPGRTPSALGGLFVVASLGLIAVRRRRSFSRGTPTAVADTPLRRA